MIIKDLFEKKIDRSIEGVVTIGNETEEQKWQELEEYVCTDEIVKSFRTFFTLKVGMPGLPYLSTVNVTTGMPPFRGLCALQEISCFPPVSAGLNVFKYHFPLAGDGLRLPQPCKRKNIFYAPAAPAPKGVFTTPMLKTLRFLTVC